MNKEEILQRYHQEKDEGMIYIKNKALLRGFGFMILVSVFIIVMSLLLNGDIIMCDIIFILIIPFMCFLYGFRGFYLKQKTSIMLSIFWFLSLCIRFYDIIDVLFN